MLNKIEETVEENVKRTRSNYRPLRNTFRDGKPRRIYRLVWSVDISQLEISCTPYTGKSHSKCRYICCQTFADDTKIYRELNHANDTSALKLDLDSLENWTKSWQVKLNPQKWEVMRITHKHDKSKHAYYLSKTELNLSTQIRTLALMSKDLSQSNHVNVTVNKANKALDLLKRTVGSKNIEIFSMLYKELVRLTLEYASLLSQKII